MKKYAVIVAAGSGKRMNSAIPKQFMLLKGKPILYYSINTFLNSFEDIEIILVLSKDYLKEGKHLVSKFFDTNRITITKGGLTRFHSVQNGLKLISEESIIFVHDGVRALVTENLIYCCYEQALKLGVAIPAIPCTDSIRMLTLEGSIAVDRNTIQLVQTPQTFKSSILLPAFKTEHKDSFTDEANTVEAYGTLIHLIEGEASNIKITHPADLWIAEKMLELREK